MEWLLESQAFGGFFLWNCSGPLRKNSLICKRKGLKEVLFTIALTLLLPCPPPHFLFSTSHIFPYTGLLAHSFHPVFSIYFRQKFSCHHLWEIVMEVRGRIRLAERGRAEAG